MKYLKKFNESIKDCQSEELELYYNLFIKWGMNTSQGVFRPSTIVSTTPPYQYISSSISMGNVEGSIYSEVSVSKNDILNINLWGPGYFLYKILRKEYTEDYELIKLVKNSIKKGFRVKFNLGRPVGDVTPRRGANIFKNFVGLSEILKFLENDTKWWTYRSYTLPAFLKTAETNDIKNWWNHIKNSPDIFKILHFLKTNFRNTRVASEISTDCVGYYERFKLIVGKEEIESIETGEDMGGLGF